MGKERGQQDHSRGYEAADVWHKTTHEAMRLLTRWRRREAGKTTHEAMRLLDVWHKTTHEAMRLQTCGTRPLTRP